MKTHLLFGIRSNSLEEVRVRVEAVLGVSLRAHDYRYGEVGHEDFILQHNFDPIDGEWTEPSARAYGILLYANATSRPAELRAVMAPFAELIRGSF
jgi:hypothetical protein